MLRGGRSDISRYRSKTDYQTHRFRSHFDKEFCCSTVTVMSCNQPVGNPMANCNAATKQTHRDAPDNPCQRSTMSSFTQLFLTVDSVSLRDFQKTARRHMCFKNNHVQANELICLVLVIQT